MGYNLIKIEDITENIVKALELNKSNRMNKIKKLKLPYVVKDFLTYFAGHKEMYESFKNKQRSYFLFHLQK